MPEPIDHYRVYDFESQTNQKQLQVRGQFDFRELPPPHWRPATIVGPTQILNPTDKEVVSLWPWPDRAKRQHHEDHLLWYNTDPVVDRTKRHARVRNQFYGKGAWINLDALVGFLAPASKSETPDAEPSTQLPERLDHYLLYNIADGPRPGVKVVLNDQFNEKGSLYTVSIPYMLGVPADKKVDGQETLRANPDAHIVFYQLTDQGPLIQETRNARDQFGKYGFTTNRSGLLGVPTVKETYDQGWIDLEEANEDYLEMLRLAQIKK
jgi:hypothetical protein